MPQTNRSFSSTGLVPTLPAHIFTRSGASLDPRGDVWTWSDGPFDSTIDFRKYRNESRKFTPYLKLALIPFVKGYSCHYADNLQGVFLHFTKTIASPIFGNIAPSHISDYANKLRAHERWRLGTLSTLLQKWVELGLPGVEPECALFLTEQRKPGNTKGEAVRTRNPVSGPFSEGEYTALYSAVNTAYGQGVLALWTLVLFRLLLACGGRISQYASLKVKDFSISTHVLKLPQAKTGEIHTRVTFLEFDISPQTSRLIKDYMSELRRQGFGEDAPLFPESLVSTLTRRKARKPDDLFFGHCTPSGLSQRFNNCLSDIAPPTPRLDFAPIPVTPRRFRYTFGTRLAEEGVSKIVIANRLGHADLQHVDVYVAASPKITENIDLAMGRSLTPLARAFKGQLVEDETKTTHKGALGSRIIDFRVSTAPVGSCAGKGQGCAFNKPVACYSCFRFEPWLDAPHENVLARLKAEREKWASDERIAAINDESIRAAEEVVALCARQNSQRRHADKENAS